MFADLPVVIRLARILVQENGGSTDNVAHAVANEIDSSNGGLLGIARHVRRNE